MEYLALFVSIVRFLMSCFVGTFGSLLLSFCKSCWVRTDMADYGPGSWCCTNDSYDVMKANNVSEGDCTLMKWDLFWEDSPVYFSVVRLLLLVTYVQYPLVGFVSAANCNPVESMKKMGPNYIIALFVSALLPCMMLGVSMILMVRNYKDDFRWKDYNPTLASTAMTVSIVIISAELIFLLIVIFTWLCQRFKLTRIR